MHLSYCITKRQPSFFLLLSFNIISRLLLLNAHALHISSRVCKLSFDNFRQLLSTSRLVGVVVVKVSHKMVGWLGHGRRMCSFAKMNKGMQTRNAFPRCLPETVAARHHLLFENNHIYMGGCVPLIHNKQLTTTWVWVSHAINDDHCCDALHLGPKRVLHSKIVVIINRSNFCFPG